MGKIQSDIRKISKNERLLGEGGDSKHGVDAWNRKLATEIERLQRNGNTPTLTVIGEKVVLKK